MKIINTFVFKIILILCCVLLFDGVSVFAQKELTIKDSTATQILRRFLQEREELFYEYSYQIQTRSGIFGNQSKEDLRQANKVLLEIVDEDNKIIKALDNLLASQRFETVNTKIETNKKEQKVDKLLTTIDSMYAEKLILKSKIQAADKQAGISTMLMYLGFGLALLFAILWLGKLSEIKTSNRRKPTR